uniref:Uncharacterized protein n=1 Tax=Rhizophora mucronata TaxID=61149 RepID=A0A2P2LQW7_RHIMU
MLCIIKIHLYLWGSQVIKMQMDFNTGKPLYFFGIKIVQALFLFFFF